VSATDGSTIFAHAIGVALGFTNASQGVGVGAAAGASVAINSIANSVGATISNAAVTAPGGAVKVGAAETASISGLPVGAAVVVVNAQSVAVGLALGAAVSKNDIANHVTALMPANASVQPGAASLDVTATDSSGIDATSVAAAVSITLGSQGAGIAVAIAGANAFNGIHDVVTATIERSQPTLPGPA